MYREHRSKAIKEIEQSKEENGSDGTCMGRCQDVPWYYNFWVHSGLSVASGFDFWTNVSLCIPHYVMVDRAEETQCPKNNSTTAARQKRVGERAVSCLKITW